jgi:hypothetical protein
MIHFSALLWYVLTHRISKLQQQLLIIFQIAPLIFKGAGLDGTASQLLATGLNGVVSVIATIPAVMFIDRWGRVKTLLVGGTGMGVTMLLAGALLGGKIYITCITCLQFRN